MSQNTSSAVIAQRACERDGFDFFPTPGWGTRALHRHVVDLSGAIIHEPACGRGHMARVLAEFAGRVTAADIQDLGYGAVEDFLLTGQDSLFSQPIDADWIISNPPFNRLLEFILTGLQHARRGVAMLGRLQMLEGIERYTQIYVPYHGHFTVAPFVERLPMEEGCVAPDTSSATAYAWLVIDKHSPRSPAIHIPPCRAELERPEDYDPPELIAQIRAWKEERKREAA